MISIPEIYSMKNSTKFLVSHSIHVSQKVIKRKLFIEQHQNHSYIVKRWNMLNPIFLWRCPWRRSFFRSFWDRWGWISRNVNNTQFKLLHNFTILLGKLQSNSEHIRVQKDWTLNWISRKDHSSKYPTISATTSFAVAPSEATTLCRRNLSLHCISGGASFCACIVTATFHSTATNHQGKSLNKAIGKLKEKSFLLQQLAICVEEQVT